MLDVLCADRFADAGVSECWATLLDEGTYLCSESTMHRILRDHGLAGQRRQRQPGRHHRPRLVATAPNMVWVWDISRLPGSAKGVWFYLYAVWDLWSRKTVGWCVDTVETAEIAERLMTVTAKREHVDRHQLVIHSDRGAQMTAGTITDLYDMLGIRRSLSRPRVSNDNPHAEAGFKTLKYSDFTISTCVSPQGQHSAVCRSGFIAVGLWCNSPLRHQVAFGSRSDIGGWHQSRRDALSA